MLNLSPTLCPDVGDNVHGIGGAVAAVRLGNAGIALGLESKV